LCLRQGRRKNAAHQPTLHSCASAGAPEEHPVYRKIIIRSSAPEELPVGETPATGKRKELYALRSTRLFMCQLLVV
jgi:hypothetical protein